MSQVVDPEAWVRTLVAADEMGARGRAESGRDARQLARVLEGVRRREEWRRRRSGALVGVLAAASLAGLWLSARPSVVSPLSERGIRSMAARTIVGAAGDRAEIHEGDAPRTSDASDAPSPARGSSIEAGLEPEPTDAVEPASALAPARAPGTEREPEREPESQAEPRVVPRTEPSEPHADARRGAEDPTGVGVDGPDELLRRARDARAARDDARARSILLEIRDRFPTRPEAEAATLLLGRVELELARDRSAALLWFERYVDEFPEGRFVAQARGYAMVCLEQLGRGEDVRAAAREYLRHHPTGTYARQARRNLEAVDRDRP